VKLPAADSLYCRVCSPSQAGWWPDGLFWYQIRAYFYSESLMLLHGRFGVDLRRPERFRGQGARLRLPPAEGRFELTRPEQAVRYYRHETAAWWRAARETLWVVLRFLANRETYA
jgi:hypothetical protein